MGGMSVNDQQARRTGIYVVIASWLAVFCLFGYRSTFSILLGPMSEGMGLTVSATSLGYSLMMTIYAVTAFFSGMIIDKWGTRPAFVLGAVFGALGFYLTSLQSSYAGYLFTYSFFAGIGTGMLWVSSTVSVRKWYVGTSYAKMWGWAFMGAPMAQVVLSLGLKGILKSMDWRVAMQILAVVVFIALIIAALFARKNPEDYGVKPFGEMPNAADGAVQEQRSWTVKEAFKTFPVWGTIIAFLTSMLAEFLVWSQVVNFFVQDVKLDLGTATNLYIVIGVSGIITMPLLGVIADKLVIKYHNEAKGRKIMLIFGPAIGVLACALLLLTKTHIFFGIIACVLFSIYWAIEPGGCAGYAGAIYGRKSIGKIWGLATLVVMGIGPAVGTYMGGFFYDNFGSYLGSMLFALGSFAVSIGFACLLPLTAEKKKSQSNEEDVTSSSQA